MYLLVMIKIFAFVKGKRSAAAESGSAPAKGCADRAAGGQPEAVSYAVAPTQSDLAAYVEIWEEEATRWDIRAEYRAKQRFEYAEKFSRSVAEKLHARAAHLQELLADNARRSAGEQASRRNCYSTTSGSLIQIYFSSNSKNLTRSKSTVRFKIKRTTGSLIQSMLSLDPKSRNWFVINLSTSD